MRIDIVVRLCYLSPRVKHIFTLPGAFRKVQDQDVRRCLWLNVAFAHLFFLHRE